MALEASEFRGSGFGFRGFRFVLYTYNRYAREGLQFNRFPEGLHVRQSWFSTASGFDRFQAFTL